MRYLVRVRRFKLAYQDVEVDADNREDAVNKAIDAAVEDRFTDGRPEYEADADDDVIEMKNV